MSNSRSLGNGFAKKLNIDDAELIDYYKAINKHIKQMVVALAVFLCQAIVLAMSYSERYEKSFAPADLFWFWANIAIGVTCFGFIVYSFGKAYGFIDDLAKKAGHDGYSMDQLKKEAD